MNLESMVGYNEQILWRGKPNKKCFILECIFNPLMPFALIWFIIDMGVLGGTLFASQYSDFKVFIIIPFLLLHMAPVWIYLIGIIFSIRKYKNTEYIITSKGIYVSGGTFSNTYEMKPFTDLSHVNIHIGIFDKKIGVGDVISECNHQSINQSTSHGGHSHGISICDIEDYQYVFQLIKQMQTDIYADTMYPNAYRPGQNPGYQTQYSGPAVQPDFRNQQYYQNNQYLPNNQYDQNNQYNQTNQNNTNNMKW